MITQKLEFQIFHLIVVRVSILLTEVGSQNVARGLEFVMHALPQITVGRAPAPATGETASLHQRFAFVFRGDDRLQTLPHTPRSEEVVAR